MKKFHVKLLLIWGIITCKYRHVVFIALDEKNFTEAVKMACWNEGNVNKVQIGYFGMQKVQSYIAIQAASKSISEADMIIADIENKVYIDECLKARGLSSEKKY